jgi:S-adenosylmethionine hydrolase
MNANPVVTLTTDFGEESPYVAAMKGVLLAVNPAVRIIDLSHQIPPQDLRYAAFFLRGAVPCFPQGTIHVVVVDPGVGTDRALLCVELFGQKLLVPDNGCWTLLTDLAAAPPVVIRLTETRYWRQPVAPTFHGRDILAPVAGHLSLGVGPSALGTPVPMWETISLPAAHISDGGAAGEVVFIDRFGNLITNIPAEHCQDPQSRVTIGSVLVPRVRAYADVPPGTLVALVSSFGLLEIAIAQGSAARQLGATMGTAVHVQRVKPRTA